MMEVNSMLDFYLESYKQLLKNAQEFPQNLGSIPPEEILQESQTLQQKQDKLRKYDALMVQAIKESENDSINWDKVKECQELIQEIVDIFDSISMRAHTHKAMLAEELKNVGKGLLSLKGYSSTAETSSTLLKSSI